MQTQTLVRTAVVLGLLTLAVNPAFSTVSAAQLSFEQVTRNLDSADADVRFQAARLLKDAAYPEAAVPLAKLVTDREDAIQLEAIAAELNIFRAEKIVARRRVGMLVEVRNRIAAEATFSAGPLILGERPVPIEVLTALRTAARDDNPSVAFEALYAFGALAIAPGGQARRELLHACGPDLAAMIGSPNPALRLAAVRVLGRLFDRRPQDAPIDQTVGDGVITALNDRDRGVRTAAMGALGAMRYDRAVEALIKQFQYFGRGAQAEAALDAIARIAHPSGAPVLVAQLSANGSALKAIAIEGLARLGDRAALADIQRALGGERDRRLLLAGSFADALLSNAPVDPLAEALLRPELRDQALRYLVEASIGRASSFSRHAQDPDAEVRAAVADILGLAGDPAALPVIEPLLKDPDPRVVRAAARAVSRLRVAGA